MSIIKMQRVAVIGLDTEKEKLMNQLMDFGAVELTDQSGKVQLDTYERALAQMTGQTVKESWIYSFALGRAFRTDQK